MASADPPPGPRPARGYWATLWRAAQEADAEGWERMRDGAPFRMARWATLLVGFAVFWGVNGTPASLTRWVPFFVFAAIMVLPDTSSVSFAGTTWKAAKQEADRAEHERRETERIAVYFVAGRDGGMVSAEVAQAATAPEAEAGEAMREFLES